MATERLTVIFGVVLSFAAVLLVSVNCNGIPHKMKCLDTEVDLSGVFKGWMECAATQLSEEDMKALKDPDTPADKKKEIGAEAHKNMCIRVCQWKKHQHWIQEDGKLNKTAQGEWIDKAFPEAAREGLKTGLPKCFEDHSTGLSEENKCESYKPFEECMTKIYADVCKVDIKNIHMSK